MTGVFDGEYSQHRHDMDIPEDCQDFFVMATVRNPYSRAVSLWYHRLREIRWDMHKDLAPRERRRQPIPYEKLQFTEYLHKLRTEQLTDFYEFNCCRWFKWVKQDVCAMPMEHLEKLNELAIGTHEVLIPKLNKTTHGDWRDVYEGKPDLAEKVYLWAEADFKRFGYKEDSWLKT